MRLLGYVRVSTEEQAADGHSLGLQPERLRQYAALHGHTLVEVIADEGVSASVPLARRRGGAALLQRLRAGHAEGVVVVRLDRLFRSALDGLRFFEETAESLALAVHSVTELIDTSTPQGRLMLTIQLGTAQYERDLAVLRAQENTRGLRQQGRVYGHVPYGCLAIDGQLYRCPRQWPQRERIVGWRAGGWSLRTIKSALHDEGIAAPNGGRWWSTSTLKVLCDSHADLAHLPLHGVHDGAAAPGAHDTGVSP